MRDWIELEKQASFLAYRENTLKLSNLFPQKGLKELKKLFLKSKIPKLTQYQFFEELQHMLCRHSPWANQDSMAASVTGRPHRSELSRCLTPNVAASNDRFGSLAAGDSKKNQCAPRVVSRPSVRMGIGPGQALAEWLLPGMSVQMYTQLGPSRKNASIAGSESGISVSHQGSWTSSPNQCCGPGRQHSRMATPWPPTS